MKTITLPFRLKRPVLACGADLKGAFALGYGEEAFIKSGFGDLGDPDNYTSYKGAVMECVRSTGIKPKIIACDMHPGYFSSRLATHPTPYTLHPTPYKVQHHEAHIASAIVDKGIKGKVIGVAFDGTGFGLDGNIWGGEFLVGDLKGFRRRAHIGYIPMPGAETAIREPWRMAASYLYHAFGDDFLDLKIDFVKKIRRSKWAVLKEMIEKKVNAPLTSSMGRFFDAAGSIIMSKEKVISEAEIPVELERMISGSCQNMYSYSIKTGDSVSIIDSAQVIKGVVKDLLKDVDKSAISAKFHNTVADMILRVSLDLRRRFKVGKVVISGGVFQNIYLSDRAVRLLGKYGFKVYTHSAVSASDSGIPIGQLAIASARARCA